MSEPLGYLLTWTTYGTWLPGDDRGWVESGKFGIQRPNPSRLLMARRYMTASPVILDLSQRRIVEATIRDHCQIRHWTLHAVNVRSNHVHVVVTANIPPEGVMRQLKAWCSRRLTEAPAPPARSASEGRATRNGQKRWWTEHGSTKWINDEEYLMNAIRYVLEGQ
jgi:REP element-mobilizing transposase RayT